MESPHIAVGAAAYALFAAANATPSGTAAAASAVTRQCHIDQATITAARASGFIVYHSGVINPK